MEDGNSRIISVFSDLWRAVSNVIRPFLCKESGILNNVIYDDRQSIGG